MAEPVRTCHLDQFRSIYIHFVFIYIEYKNMKVAWLNYSQTGFEPDPSLAGSVYTAFDHRSI